MTILSVILVMLGIALVAGAFFLVQNFQQGDLASEALIPQALIMYEYRKEIYIPNPTRSKLISAIENAILSTSIDMGSLKYIYFTQDNQHKAKELMSTQDFLEILRVKISPTLSRSFDGNFKYGIYSTTENSPFLVLRVANFDIAYAEILKWEANMGFDLGPLLNRSEQDYARSSFVDVVYYNKDARAILDIAGKPILGYSFIDPRTVVFFSNRLTLREVVNRTQRNIIKR